MSNPMELQMQWAIARKKGYFVGGRTIEVLERRPLDRMLVGFCAEPDGTLPKEGHLIIDHGSVIGRVTSCCFSPTLQKVIGLAYVEPAAAEPGTTISIGVDSGRVVTAKAVSLPFFDAHGQRQEL